MPGDRIALGLVDAGFGRRRRGVRGESLAFLQRQGFADEELSRRADPRTDISSIKVFVPQAYHRVVDRAIQVWGAAGVSGDLPLAGMYQGARTLRLADGPDEVHKILIAKMVLRRYHGGESWDFGN